jgi:hypothetical protein
MNEQVALVTGADNPCDLTPPGSTSHAVDGVRSRAPGCAVAPLAAAAGHIQRRTTTRT